MSYKPSENDGRRLDGEVDNRVTSEHGFGSRDKAEVSNLGKQGGSTQPDEIYKPSEHDGLKKDGTPDKRLSSEHGFGSRREEAVEAGRVGGSK